MFCQICKSSIRRFKEIEYKQKLKHAELFLTSYLFFFFFSSVLKNKIMGSDPSFLAV